MGELNNFDLRFLSYRKWIIKTEYYYQVSNHLIIVPADFVTDLASIPKIFWCFLEPYGKNYVRASVIHDYLYSKKSIEVYKDLPRKEADKIFLEVMEIEGVFIFKRYMLYIFVRIFGFFFFRRK